MSTKFKTGKRFILHMIYAIMTVCLLTSCNYSIAQSTKAPSAYYKANLLHIDTAEAYYTGTFCTDSVSYPAKYDREKINKDVSILQVFQKIFERNITPLQLDSCLRTIKGVYTWNDKTNNGLIEIRTIGATANYIRFQGKIEFIGNTVIRKSYRLSPARARCDTHGPEIPDFKLVKTIILPEISFLVLVDGMDLIADSLFVDNIRSAASQFPSYRMRVPNPSNEEWLNTILSNQYKPDANCCYSRAKGHDDFIAMIKHERIDIIKDLLYSPNYLYAVHALESLVFLVAEGKVVIDEGMKKQMESIRQGESKITIQASSDYYETVSGYKQINTSDAKVIRKYKYSLD